MEGEIAGPSSHGISAQQNIFFRGEMNQPAPSGLAEEGKAQKGNREQPERENLGTSSLGSSQRRLWS